MSRVGVVGTGALGVLTLQAAHRLPPVVQEERCPCPDPVAAPVVWKGSSHADILNEQFRPQNAAIGRTVFAIKK